MPDATSVFKAVRCFLESSAANDSRVQELRQTIANMLDIGHCALGEGSYCANHYLEGLLRQMKNIDGWTQVHHESALVAGGYAPDFFPWPVKPAGP